MASVNKVILIGNLGKDPEVRHLDNNLVVARFPIATTESYKDKNGDWQDNTEWHNIVAWRYLAERAEKYLKKGMQVYVEGKLTTRSYEDKDGIKKYTTEVVAQNVTMLGRREDNTNASSEPSVSQNIDNGNQQPVEDPGDDLPF